MPDAVSWYRKVGVRLSGKENANSLGARPVHLIITMLKWFRTSTLSTKNSLAVSWNISDIVASCNSEHLWRISRTRIKCTRRRCSRAIPVKVAAKRLPVFPFSRPLKGCKGHNTHRFESGGTNQIRKTGKREVVFLQPLPQTLYMYDKWFCKATQM